jgi:hypothetical protein
VWGIDGGLVFEERKSDANAIKNKNIVTGVRDLLGLDLLRVAGSGTSRLRYVFSGSGVAF